MTQIAGHTDELKARKVELVLQQLDSLPTLPAIAIRLLSLTGNAEAKIQEVTSLLAADQSLTSKVLSLVQSAATGLKHPVTTVQQAVVMLGFDALRNLILSVKVFEAFNPAQALERHDGDASPFKREEFWKHSLAVATAAELLAPRCKAKVSASDAFVCGLLHDIGKVAFDSVMPKSFGRVIEVAMLTRGDVAEVERRIIGLDHALAGKRLAEAWNLPAVITQAIWLHGTSPLAAQAGANSAVVLLVGLADLLARRQHIGFSGNYLYPYETAQYAQALGILEKDIVGVTAQLTDSLEKKARAIGLYDVESRQLYLESIANANAELGRVNQTLTMQNRKLALRSQCFELMTKFYQQIVPAATPAQLLIEAGNVSHQFFDSHRLVMFSQDPEQEVGEVVTFDPTHAAQDSFLMNMPRYGGDQRVGRAGQNFTRPATPQLDWLFERVQGFLGTRNCWFMPLLCGQEPVGGIVWVAKDQANAMTGLADLMLVSQSWGMTLRTAQVREQQTILTESLAAANRELGTLQTQLVRAKSLASLGEMAAGAAHEMNNPLAVVCGRAQLLAAKLSDAGLKADASLIAAQGDRLSQIITDMMDFARPAAPKFGAVDVSRVVEEAVQLASERLGVVAAAPAIKIEIAPQLPAVKADGKLLRSAMAEVLLNALQATKAAETQLGRTGGEVLLQVRHEPLDNNLIIQVTDRGTGMNEDVMKNAFSPFFSAKSAGRNRGMGLAKALRWLESHGGTIRLDSALGAGTTAVMILPLREMAGQAVAAQVG